MVGSWGRRSSVFAGFGTVVVKIVCRRVFRGRLMQCWKIGSDAVRANVVVCGAHRIYMVELVVCQRRLRYSEVCQSREVREMLLF